MSVKITFIFWIICAYRITVVFSNACVEKCNSGTVNNLLGPMVHSIVNRYFSNSHCVCVITEGNGFILEYIPKSVPVVHIQISGIGSAIKEVEDSDTLDSTKLTNDTQKFERLLIESMEAGCESYIVQVRKIKSVIHSIARTTRRAATRYRKKFLYLPVTLEGEILQLKNIFSMKEMNYMPDLIIARFVNSEITESHLIPYRHVDITSKGRSYNSKVIRHFSDETSLTSQRNHQENEKRQMFSKSIGNGVLTQKCEASNCKTSEKVCCVKESKCVISAGGRCLKASDDVRMVTNTSVNICISSSLNKVNGKTNAIQIVTHKFVGKNPSSEAVLDVWITDGQQAGFLACADLFPDKMRNLEGRVVTATTFNYVPFFVLIGDEEKRVYDGIELLAIMEFAKKLNFTWKLILEEDNLWGATWPNGSGNGVVGNVATDEADLGFVGLYTWYSTFLLVDFTSVVSKTGCTCLVPKPKMLPSWMSLWLPFSPVMWAAISVCIIVITVVFYMLAETSNKYLGATTLESYATCINCLLTTLGMFVLQPPPDPQTTNHSAVKGFVVIVLIFFLLVSSVYSGGLASVLTVPRYEHPIDTVKELADSKLPWANVHEVWVWSLLDNDDYASKMLVQHFQVLTEEEMKVLSTQGNTAFSLEKLFISNQFSVPAHINETAIQTLRIMKEMMYGSYTVMYIRKSSPYKESLNQLIRGLYEAGILQYWEGQTIRRYMSERLQIAIIQSVVLGYQDGPLQITIEHLEGAFGILVFGLSLATFFFIIEIACSVIKQYHGSFENKFC